MSATADLAAVVRELIEAVRTARRGREIFVARELIEDAARLAAEAGYSSPPLLIYTYSEPARDGMTVSTTRLTVCAPGGESVLSVRLNETLLAAEPHHGPSGPVGVPIDQRRFRLTPGQRRELLGTLTRWRIALDAELAEVGGHVAEAAHRATEPDAKGYVANPVDPSAYVLVSKIVAESKLADLNDKKVGRIVENFDVNRVRWSRPSSRAGTLIKNRRLVHLGDWNDYEARQIGTHSDGWPRTTPEEREARAKGISSKRYE